MARTGFQIEKGVNSFFSDVIIWLINADENKVNIHKLIIETPIVKDCV